MDETGIGNPETDRYAIVVAAISPGGFRGTLATEGLGVLANQIVPTAQGRGFTFHAKDLYHGKKEFDSAIYHDREFRYRTLEFICGLASFFDLRVIIAAGDREAVRSAIPGASAAQLQAAAHVEALRYCLWNVERYMQFHDPGGLALLVYDDTISMRGKLNQAAQALFDSRDNDGNPEFPSLIPQLSFKEKSTFRMLQIADACCFAVLRKLAGDDRFYNQLGSAILARPEWLAPPRSAPRIPLETLKWPPA